MILAPQSTDGFYFVGVGNSFFLEVDEGITMSAQNRTCGSLEG